MKSWLSVGGSLVALALLTSPALFAAESVNVGGLLKIDSGATNTLVAVPWVGFDASGTKPIDVAALVKTINLVTGDTLIALGEDGRHYEAWAIGDDGRWTPITTVDKTSAAVQHVVVSLDPAERPLQRGSAVWVVRCGAGSDVSRPIYVSGQFSSASGSRTLAAGSVKSPWRSLVSVPTVAGFDLNSIQEGVDEKDEIDFITDTTPRTYTPKKVDDKWVWGWEESVVEEKSTPLGKTKVTKVVRHESETVVPFGRGFWYLSRGGKPTVRW